MKPGRNQPCPCGSGRKFKHCCGAQPPAGRRASNPADALREALAHHQAGRLTRAEALYRQVLAAEPKNCDALHLLGVLAGQRGDAARGVTLIRAALAQRPNLAEAHNNLGNLLQAEGKQQEAIAAYRAALEARPDYPEAALNLGLAYQAQGRLEEAAASYRHALEGRPRSAEAHHNLGLALQGLNRFEEALNAYRQALDLQPARAETHNNLGNVLRAMGRREQAVTCYQRALELRPDYPEAHCNLALTLNEQHQSKQALDHYRRALTLDPDHREAHYGVARLLHERGQFEEAAAAYREMIHRYPGHLEPYAALTRCKRITADDVPLIQEMESRLAAGDMPPRDAISLHLALGKAYDDLGDYARAISHFHRGNRLQADGCPFDRTGHETLVTTLITTYGRDCFDGERAQDEPSPLPVLIIGMPRSGTTLAEQVLSRHPAVGAGGELDFWARHEPALVGHPGGPPDPAAGRAAAKAYIDHLKELAPGARCVTDKLTTNFLRLGTIHRLLPQARIIHCRRNALDTCVSVYFTRFAGSHCYSYDLEDLAFYYEQYRRLMAHWRTVLPADRFHEVDYEAMVTEPERTIRELVAFCGLAWSPDCLDSSAGERAIRTASKWQVRQPIYTSSVQRWRHYEPYLGPLLRLKDLS